MAWDLGRDCYHNRIPKRNEDRTGRELASVKRRVGRVGVAAPTPRAPRRSRSGVAWESAAECRENGRPGRPVRVRVRQGARNSEFVLKTGHALQHARGERHLSALPLASFATRRRRRGGTASTSPDRCDWRALRTCGWGCVTVGCPPAWAHSPRGTAAALSPPGRSLCSRARLPLHRIASRASMCLSPLRGSCAHIHLSLFLSFLSLYLTLWYRPCCKSQLTLQPERRPSGGGMHAKPAKRWQMTSSSCMVVTAGRVSRQCQRCVRRVVFRARTQSYHEWRFDRR